MGRSKIESDVEEFSSEFESDSDDSLPLSEELDDDESDRDQNSRANRVLRKSSVGKNNKNSLCNKPRRSAPRRASAAKVSYNIPDSDEEEENEPPSPSPSPPKKKIKKEEGRQIQQHSEDTTKQKLKKIQKQVQKEQPSGSSDDKATTQAATISVPLKNADKLAAILAKMPKAKKEETLLGNNKVINNNSSSKRGKGGNDSDPTTKKTKETPSLLLADAKKEDEEWTGVSSSEDEDDSNQEEDGFVSESESSKKPTAQKRNSTLKGGIKRANAKSNNGLSKIIIRNDTEDEIGKKFDRLKDKLTCSLMEYETKFGAGGTPSICK
eukprot:125320_1